MALIHILIPTTTNARNRGCRLNLSPRITAMPGRSNPWSIPHVENVHMLRARIDDYVMRGLSGPVYLSHTPVRTCGFDRRVWRGRTVILQSTVPSKKMCKSELPHRPWHPKWTLLCMTSFWDNMVINWKKLQHYKHAHPSCSLSLAWNSCTQNMTSHTYHPIPILVSHSQLVATLIFFSIFSQALFLGLHIYVLRATNICHSLYLTMTLKN